MHVKRTGSRVVAVVAALLLAVAAFVVAPARATDAPPLLGTDYFKIDAPTPASGPKVQVVEVFGYGCPICARFQPYLSAWEKKLPADVAFSYLPATFGADPEHCWDDFARAFFAAQVMGIAAKSHDGIYKAKFEQGRIETCAAIPAAYADYGPDPSVFASTMNSFPVNAKMATDHDLILRWGVDGTPTMVIDGTWRVVMTRGGGPEGMLRAVDWLIAKQRSLHHAAPARTTHRQR